MLRPRGDGRVETLFSGMWVGKWVSGSGCETFKRVNSIGRNYLCRSFLSQAEFSLILSRFYQAFLVAMGGWTWFHWEVSRNYIAKSNLLNGVDKAFLLTEVVIFEILHSISIDLNFPKNSPDSNRSFDKTLVSKAFSEWAERRMKKAGVCVCVGLIAQRRVSHLPPSSFEALHVGVDGRKKSNPQFYFQLFLSSSTSSRSNRKFQYGIDE